jgi:uncharacterized protein YhdP
MVKRLRICIKCLKATLLLVLLILIWGVVWLQASERSLAFAKPWILSSLNPPDAPYDIQFDTVTIDWRNLTQLGTLHVTHITFANHGGSIFAHLPEVYVTIDPLGFLPHRHVVNKVILHAPHLYLTHTKEGVWQVGIEGAGAPVAISDILAPLSANIQQSSAPQPVELPFRAFVIDHAEVKLHDEVSNAHVESTNFSLTLNRARHRYHGKLLAAYSYGDQSGDIMATLEPTVGTRDYMLDTTINQFPATLVCSFGGCPEKTTVSGLLDARMRIGITASGTPGGIWAQINTNQAMLNAPNWFAEPLKLGSSAATVTYDAAVHMASVSDLKVALEDTTITATGTAQKKEDGWYTEVSGACSDLDITKLYKYWPIAMAHDSRLWVTSKLKAGHAKGTLKLHLAPPDYTAENVPDKALDADVDAQDITVDYLPGFPLLSHVSGLVHFTGATVKVDGKGGTMLTGTKVSKSTLWCPDLLNPKNPMEVSLSVESPMADVASLLSLKIFTFDDAAGLDPKSITGNTTADLKLKFDAFSGNKTANPDEIHLDAVDYAIKANLQNVAQKGLFGGYDVKSVNGDLVADTKSTNFNGSLILGESNLTDIKLVSREGAALTLDVHSRPDAAGTNKQALVPLSGNDFTLTYQRSAVPKIVIKGKRLDGSVSYSTSDNSLLKDFPSLDLTLAIDELILAPVIQLRAVDGTLYCTTQRCESAHIRALSGRGKVTADIGKLQGVRQFNLTASDAGEFLKAIDMTDRMTRGKLDLHGSYDDSKLPAPFNGKLFIQDFTLQNSQILGRILSIGSLTGLANALTGSGISFDKMMADVNERAGLVTVSEGRANGNAMGITFAGTVDTTTTKLGLKGVVVPAYALNSILGNIPIIGKLAGGEGEGLIAFNYSVKGTYREPDVGVNPLSGLTPGFLRGIFGIFDQSPSKSDDKPADSAKPVETPEAQKPVKNRR